VLKELSTKRLAKDRAAVVQISLQIFPMLHEAYRLRSGQLLGVLSTMIQKWEAGGKVDVSEEDSLKPLAELVTYLVKCMHRVVLSGFPTSLQPQEGTGISPQDIAQFFEGLLQHECAVLDYLRKRCKLQIVGDAAAQDDKSFVDHLSKITYRMTLIVIEAQRQSPLPFRAFLAPFLGQFHDQLMQLYGEQPPPPVAEDSDDCNAPTPWTSPRGLEKLAINALTFLAQVLGSDEYRPDLLTLHATSASHSITATGNQEVKIFS
jgi:hypothetical protein